MQNRFWEIDFFRGLAIVMILVSNLVTDLSYFGIYDINIYSGFWWFFARVVVFIFILLVGVSLTLSYSRVKDEPTKEIHIKYLKRGMKILGWGMTITLVTWIFLKEDFILFGVLHLIGISIILAHFILKQRFLNLLLGSLFILIGISLQNMTFDFYWFVWLGLRPSGFHSIDYVPILPWFGVVLVGVFLGNIFYPEGRKRFRIPYIHNHLTKLLCFLGRNSLLIYLTHQPVLVITLWLLFPFPQGFPL